MATIITCENWMIKYLIAVLSAKFHSNQETTRPEPQELNSR